MAWLSGDSINKMGFASVGENTLLSERASYYGCKDIFIGKNVRIDDFCVLSAGKGGIIIGNFVHIGVYSSLIGEGKISIDDFCNISSKVSIYSSNDDYSGKAMSNPMVPNEYKEVIHADVILQKHVIIGSSSIILPGIIIEEGVAIGALSLIKMNCTCFGIYAGQPAKRIKERSRNLLSIEYNFNQCVNRR